MQRGAAALTSGLDHIDHPQAVGGALREQHASAEQ